MYQDMFSVCTAGDVRVSFEAVIVPQISGATVIGKLLNDKGNVGVYTTTRYVSISFSMRGYSNY